MRNYKGMLEKDTIRIRREKRLVLTYSETETCEKEKKYNG